MYFEQAIAKGDNEDVSKVVLKFDICIVIERLRRNLYR